MSEPKVYPAGDPALMVLWKMGLELQVANKDDEEPSWYDRYSENNYLPPTFDANIYRVKPKESSDGTDLTKK